MCLSNKKLLRWQIALAVIGSLFWLLSINHADSIKMRGWIEMYNFLAGYIFGFIIAFSGFMLWEILCGRGRQFLDDNLLTRWLSYIVLATILIMGLAGVVVEISGDTDWLYNIGSLIGAFVVSAGLLPVVEKYDRVQT